MTIQTMNKAILRGRKACQVAPNSPASSRSPRYVSHGPGVSLGDIDRWPTDSESDGASRRKESPNGPRQVLRRLALTGASPKGCRQPCMCPKRSLWIHHSRCDHFEGTESDIDTSCDESSYVSSDANKNHSYDQDHQYHRHRSGVNAVLPWLASTTSGGPLSDDDYDDDEDYDEVDDRSMEVDTEEEEDDDDEDSEDESHQLQPVPSRPRSVPSNSPNHTSQFPELANLPPLPQPPAGFVPLPAITMPNGQVIDPVHYSNANPTVLGLENLGLFDFLRGWAAQAHFGIASGLGGPNIHEVLRQERVNRREISYDDLRGDRCDFQGLDWLSMGTTRSAARSRRQYTYRNYVNRQDSDKWNTRHCSCSGREESNFFKFKRTSFQNDVCLAHFQLRSVLGCPTRTNAFYPGRTGIRRFNTLSGKTDTFLEIPEFSMTGSTVTTLDADLGVVMCGTFEGNYVVKAVESEEPGPDAKGQISAYESGITNHIKIEQSRSSSSPTAAIASNDDFLRLYDFATDTFVAKRRYPVAMNCTALSPNKTMRALVGDSDKILITDDNTGKIQFQLSGHRDYGFACAWSDDGYTLATGSQDMAIKIWDARYWSSNSGVCQPLHTIKSELAGARTLKFSLVGSGPPVLVAAEEADFVNIIDAKSYNTKQTIDVFGEICGASFTNEGQNLNILCRDSHRGGLLQFERCGGGLEKLHGLPRETVWLADNDALEPF
ncbi:hypothetical protein VHEMI01804 [[Torrubiella] hemipterigena]|uniref:Uncharacterized protein n=1 Tax=[Torrubiella] hemipterigena TaxID=1531966 RepID=A0A0A1SMY1_9HYPO|nr:hypothetical protein VHEMI01804 [[Torrubiella] hemipterigena]